ncbi:hypothetical protein KSF_037720 [Reticulibacter mediterranei]|uniref:MmyB-like transcription regulator ligand binding domain-containing protein n=1 Tax=Reticulibacter mediterranei TaxID=2778369 RepID=A0A8J3ILI3_9CHLR|nr:hypothetical protein [Reticulibacter mediterranei]GHO93724.1 hypothetical protein KSF_037720 [Reticulibacter mediterranei]
MIESIPGSSQKPAMLRELLEEIEILRIARQQEVRNHPHPFLKRFTQQELTDEACPTYKNLLVGRSQRIPSRQTLMQIADYLECSMVQRNNLLLAARYLPESLELTGSELQLALKLGKNLMQTLPYPAILVTHTLHIEAINELFQRLFAPLPLATIPQEQRHMLSLFFRHDLPFRERSTFNKQATKAWQAGVSRGIQLFKESNRFYQFEPWYQTLVEQFCAVADFRQYWEQEVVPATLTQQQELPKLLLGRNAITGDVQQIQLRQVRISVCSRMYPCIIALLPLDEPARMVVTSLGSTEESNMSAAGLS